MKELYFMSDPHINHRGVLRNGWAKRPVDTTEEHTEWLAEGINSEVTVRDKLVFLGDLAFGHRNAVEEAAIIRDFLKRLKCTDITFVLGNHDSEAALLCLGRTPHKYLQINWLGHKFFCIHFPMLTWPDSHNGSTCCYGHTHSEYEEEFDKLMPQRRALDVGVDNALRLFGKPKPFSATEVMGLLAGRTGSFPKNDLKA